MFQIEYLEESVNALVQQLTQDYSIELLEQILAGLALIYPHYQHQVRKQSTIDRKTAVSSLKEAITLQEFISRTAKINEKCDSRKALGKYYTPQDLCTFMLTQVASNLDGELEKKSFFDPTCGNGEFILNALIYVLEQSKNSKITSKQNLSVKESQLIEQEQTFFAAEEIIALAANLYGNDINDIALLIAKVRLYFYLVLHLKSNCINQATVAQIAQTLNQNFSKVDYLNHAEQLTQQFDVIIGNPPYVEDSKYAEQIKEKFGNVYANVIKNSLHHLKEKGILALVIPLSYVSTARMRSIRDWVVKHCAWQKLYNFADRPDCLFTGVHQKLTVLLCKKDQATACQSYSSDYLYWYKQERINLFKEIPLSAVQVQEDFIPKLGSYLAASLYAKVFTLVPEESLNSFFQTLATKGSKVKQLTSTLAKIRKEQEKDNLNTQPYISFAEWLFSNEGKSEPSLSSLYLNMRATFWVKAFTDYARSNEYKEFKVDARYRDYIYCLLNSSLFFWFWTVVSDGWHLTNKEFKAFKLVLPTQPQAWQALAQALQEDLDAKKKYVGTKQTDYIYQHKNSKQLIDAIDEQLAHVYGINAAELDFIKNFAYKYRMSLGS